MKKPNVLLAALALAAAAVGFSADKAPVRSVKAQDCCTGGPCCTGGECCATGARFQ